MRLSATSLLAAFVLAASCVHAQDEAAAGRPPKPRQICNPNASGRNLQKQQQEAMEDFSDLFVNQHDVQTAFDTYTPGQYINHSPYAEQGRDYAINFLTLGFASGTLTSDLTAFAGQGYGMMHFKMHVPAWNVTWATASYMRFEGTCIVEHWDILQGIMGNETNPIAFF